MIKRGQSHLIFESEIKISFTLFKELLDSGTKGLCISSTYPKKLIKAYGVDRSDFIWLSETDDGIPPENIHEITEKLANFMDFNPGAALLLDSIESIYAENEVEDFLSFLNFIIKRAKKDRVTLMVPMDPQIFSKETLYALSSMFDRVMDVRSVSIEAEGKECPRCGALWNPTVTVCSICGYEFRGPDGIGGIGGKTGEKEEKVEKVLPQRPVKRAGAPMMGDHGPGSWFKRGVDHEKRGESEKAIEAYKKALEEAPYDPWIWINMGVSYQRLGMTEDALECYNRAIEIYPLDADAWSNKAIALRILGRIEEAIECYDRALEIDPGDAGIWSNKGVALRALGRMKEAIECYDRALEIDPYDVGTWLNKAVALQRIGRIEEALECYDRILKIDPYHPVALRNRELLSRLNPALRD